MNIKSLFRNTALRIIKSTLCLLDKDHREKNVISDDNLKKFTHHKDVNFGSDNGTAVSAVRTVPYEAWEVKTTTKTLVAADKHRVMVDGIEPVWVRDLKPGVLLMTDTGLEQVTSVRNLGVSTHMYCLEVNGDPMDPRNHTFYTDGILSHNTTTAAAYLLWAAMFMPDTKILVVANKFSAAMEIMDRVRYSYEECPDYIRAGVVEYNKGTITFDNGSKITARATTADAGRGLSITMLYCLGGETTVTVRDTTSGVIKNITLEELYAEMENEELISLD